MGLALIIIGILIVIAGFSAIFLGTRALKSVERPLSIKSLPAILLGSGSGGLGLGMLLTYLGVMVRDSLPMHTGYRFLTLSAGLVLGAAFGVFLSGFYILYFVEDLNKEEKRNAKIAAIGGGLLALAGLIFSLDGFTYLDAITYPLVYRFNIGPLAIYFYALFILGGALLAWFITEQYYRRKYKKKGIMENVFYVSFLSGILGARIWYVVGNWNHPNEPFKNDFLTVFQFWRGGLTIIGGLIFGALVGLTFWMIRRKQYSRGEVLDVVLPTILLAQAIGRWGNFFNQEVYGATTSTWTFLPVFIQKQMTIDGEFRVPLFLIESLVNIGGYFMIRYAIGKGLKNLILPGDQGFTYFLWYGIVRAIMEPLRDPKYNMGETGNWSSIQAYIWIGFGLLAIVANHLWHHFHHSSWEKVVVLPNYGKQVEAQTITIKEADVENNQTNNNELHLEGGEQDSEEEV
ncbi:MAG: prolipoprotein diacylglyceryl transferase [Erysipelotrichaceae bacterium]|nr:prolipoprotein diacylglyceryl transferase [Erysipelotrichaceae bacterium]